MLCVLFAIENVAGVMISSDGFHAIIVVCALAYQEMIVTR